MPTKKSKKWTLRHRAAFVAIAIGVSVRMICIGLELLMRCLIAEKLSFTRTMAILKSKDIGDAPEPFKMMDLFIQSGFHHTFSTTKGKELKSRICDPIAENDSLLNLMWKLEHGKSIDKDALPRKYQRGVRLVSLITLTSKISITIDHYRDMEFLELMLASNIPPANACNQEDLNAEQTLMIDQLAVNRDKWITPIQTDHSAIDVIGYLEKLQNLPNLPEKSQQLRMFAEACNCTLAVLEYGKNESQNRVVEALLDAGLDESRVVYDTSHSVRAKDLNYRILSRLDTHNQSKSIQRINLHTMEESEQDELVMFVSKRPKLFESIAWKPESINRKMVENYIRSGATRRPIFKMCGTFMDSAEMLIKEYPDVALRMIDNRQFGYFEKKDQFSDPAISMMLVFATQLPELPVKITRLTPLKLIERARLKSCFFSLIHLRRMNINDVLSAAITPDHFQFIRKHVQVSTEGVDLEKYPDSVIEEILMDDLGL
jgi:hypothetical protein